MNLYTETVTLLRAEKHDDGYGGTMTTFTEEPVHGCIVDQGASKENVSSIGVGWVLFTNLVLLVPAGTEISPLDQVRLRGTTYAVDGEIIPMRSAFTGFEPMIPVKLRRN